MASSRTSPLILGGRGCSVTFVVDSSEKMRAVLGPVKRLLVQALQARASTRDSMFNIMTSSHTVSCWSPHMLPCAPDTVYLSLSWVHAISCSPGDADLLATLSTAFSDRGCHAVHLLCTDLSDHPEAVPTALPALAAGRPVNIFYLQASGGHLGGGGRTLEYLQRLTRVTRGRCYTIPVGLNGELKVIPLSVVDNHQPSMSSVSCCCRTSSIRCTLGNLLDPGILDTLNAEFFPGCRVLARRQVDGFYYLGTIIERAQALGCDGVWVVEFDHPVTVPPQRQLVCSLDMVNHPGSLAHRPVPGDAVLSPWEPDLRRYGPGRAAEAAAQGGDGSKDDSSVRVLMWNTCVPRLLSHLAVPISESHHDRIVTELHVSASHLCHFGTCCCSLHRCDTMDRVKQPDSAPSSSSSSLCEELPPPENQVRKGERPPWKYWRRTGAEPQHRQPGGALWRMTSHPASFSSSANHSSVFQALPGFRGRGVNSGLQWSSHTNAAVYTECWRRMKVTKAL